MGIYDRDYYDNERGGAGWLADTPATKLLLITNVVLFLVQLFTAPQVGVASGMEQWFSGDSQLIFERGQIWRLLTAGFLHSHPFQLLFNMLLLWWLGKEFEISRGTKEFLVFYLVATVLSSFVQASYQALLVGDGTWRGATAAIAALFVIFVMQNPRREILLFFILPVQVWVCLAIWIAGDTLMLLAELSGRSVGGGVPSAAHLTGMLFGWLTERYGIRLGSNFSLPRLSRRVFRPRVRVVAPDDLYEKPAGSGPSKASYYSRRERPPLVTAGTRPQANPDEENLDDRLDAILAKIARDGRASLSAPEEEVLAAASQRARERREARRL